MEPSPRSKSLVVARVILVATGMITLVFGSSAAFVGEASEESVLASTFGAGMGLFTIVTAVLATSRRPSRLAWAALWYLPVFFAVHLVAFRAYVPDLPLLLLNATALLVSAPAVFTRATPARQPQHRGAPDRTAAAT